MGVGGGGDGGCRGGGGNGGGGGGDSGEGDRGGGPGGSGIGGLSGKLEGSVVCCPLPVAGSGVGCPLPVSAGGWELARVVKAASSSAAPDAVSGMRQGAIGWSLGSGEPGVDRAAPGDATMNTS